MATTNQNVTADKLISATVKYSNKDDANRVYDISANARIENEVVTNFENGVVKKLSTSESSDTMEVATFNAYGEKNINLYINNADESEASAILSAIYAFMADVRENIITKSTQA